MLCPTLDTDGWLALLTSSNASGSLSASDHITFDTVNAESAPRNFTMKLLRWFLLATVRITFIATSHLVPIWCLQGPIYQFLIEILRIPLAHCPQSTTKRSIKKNVTAWSYSATHSKTKRLVSSRATHLPPSQRRVTSEAQGGSVTNGAHTSPMPAQKNRSPLGASVACMPASRWNQSAQEKLGRRTNNAMTAKWKQIDKRRRQGDGRTTRPYRLWRHLSTAWCTENTCVCGITMQVATGGKSYSQTLGRCQQLRLRVHGTFQWLRTWAECSR